MASLRQICSIVQITSRPQHTKETNIATFVRGKRKYVEKSLRERPAQGTTTIINEFFYNMPVRYVHNLFLLQYIIYLVYEREFSYEKYYTNLRMYVLK